MNDVVCFQLLLPDSAAYTMGINELGGTTFQLHYSDAVFNVVSRSHCASSARIAMDDSLDSGYTISVKTEDDKPDTLREDTLQIIEPRHWTVNDRGVLVNADESEVGIKVEKSDWTTGTELADCSTVIARQEGGQSHYAVV